MAITFPNSPTVGQQYVAENGYTYEYDGEKWSTLPDSEGQIPAGGTTGQFLAKVNDTDYNMEWTDAAPPTSIGTTPPTGDLEDGQLWWRSDTGVLYIYYGDGDSSQWVQAAVGMDTRVQAEVYTGDVPPLGPGEGDLWWNTTDTNLYVYYQSVWVQSNPVPPEQPNYWQRDAATGVVSPSTEGDDIGGVGAINGLGFPNDGPLSCRNKIINGSMIANQRDVFPLTVSGSTNASTFGIDRFTTGAGLDAYSPAAEAIYSHEIAPTELGFARSQKITVTTSGAGNPNRDVLLLRTKLETSDLYDACYGTSEAKTMVLSFYVRTSIPGTYGMFLYNPNPTGGARQFVPGYTTTSTDWERVEILIPGDTVRNFRTDFPNEEGLRIEWRASCDGDKVGPAQTEWSDVTSQRSVTGNVDLFGTLGATWEIAGVQLEVGTQVTPFEHESQAATFQKCQRYYQRVSTPGGSVTGTYMHPDAFYVSPTTFATKMRDSPTGSLLSVDANAFYWVDPGQISFSSNSSANISFTVTPYNWGWRQIRAGTGSSGPSKHLTYVLEAAATWTFDAEL